MKIRVLALGAAALLLPFTSACGSDSGGSSEKTTTTKASSSSPSGTSSSGNGSTSAKPAAGKISASLTSGLGVATDTADCAADKLLAGDFSDEAFKAMANGKRDELPAGEADAVTKAIQTAVAECNVGS